MATEPQPSAATPLSEPASTLKTVSILYVEDDEMVREGLARFLNRRVAHLFLAENGEEGLRLYREHHPDIVLTDVMMPIMDGLEMTARIREEDRTTPVVVTTAFNEHNLLIEAINAGVDKYVLKPINTVHLLEALQKAAHTVFQRQEILRQYRELQQRNEELRLAAKVFDSTDEGILITDKDARIVMVNRAFTEITGYAADEVVDLNPRRLKSGQQETAFYEHLWARLLQHGHWQGELSNRRKNGEVYPQWTTISAVKDDEGEVSQYVAVFTDISQRKDIEERIEHLAYYDALTDLPNRVLLQDRFSQAIASARRLDKKAAILVLDLDRFKKINDSLGHSWGDHVLKEVAHRLTAAMRPSDTVARLGGDEYVVFLSQLDDDLQDAAAMAKKISAELSLPFLLDGAETSLTVSIGISIFPDDGYDVDTLLRNADSAMYEAKAAGRNAYRFYTLAMNTRIVEQLRTENALNRALERNELVVHYQPLLCLRTGRIVGTEALVRWVSPELGLVPPMQFIPLAEETGQILAIGAWVLKEACRQARVWHGDGFADLRMAVNLSAVQFKQGDVVELVRQVGEETGVDLGRIELELTESVVMHNAGEIIATLESLKAMKLKLVIDDFGTGYSNMSYLKRFPVDKLKIDKSFIRDIGDDPTDLAISRAIVALGHSINLKVLAEGVETREQLELLRSTDCDEMQGYFFSRPLPADEITRLLHAGGLQL